jgi:hypothetical protein
MKKSNCKDSTINSLWALQQFSQFIIILPFDSTWLSSRKKSVTQVSVIKRTLWLESTSKLYRLNNRHLSAKLMPTFADREWHVVSVMDPYSHIFGFLDQSRYYFYQVAPQLYSQSGLTRPQRRSKCLSYVIICCFVIIFLYLRTYQGCW